MKNRHTNISAILGEKDEKDVNMLSTRIIYTAIMLALYIAFICVEAYQWPPDCFVTIFNQLGEYTRVFDIMDYPSRILILVIFPIIFIKQMYPYMIADPTIKKEPAYTYEAPVNNKVEETKEEDDGGSVISTYIKGEMLGFWK